MQRGVFPRSFSFPLILFYLYCIREAVSRLTAFLLLLVGNASPDGFTNSPYCVSFAGFHARRLLEYFAINTLPNFNLSVFSSCSFLDFHRLLLPFVGHPSHKPLDPSFNCISCNLLLPSSPLLAYLPCLSLFFSKLKMKYIYQR